MTVRITIGGRGGDDMIIGGSGSDILSGDAGADTLDGGAGNDYLTGGANADTFRFSDGWGADRINDFDEFLAGEVIDLRNITGLDDFSQLAITQSGANAVIAFGGNTITVVDTLIANLNIGNVLVA